MNYSGCDDVYYPIMVDLTDKIVTIVGAGKIAFRKYNSMKQYCNKINIVSPKINKDFTIVKKNREDVNFIIDEYRFEYIKNSFLVIAATDINTTNNTIATDCKKNNILCNVINQAEIGDFIIPSIMRRGDLTISVSTLGSSPSLSAKIIKDLEKQFDPDYGNYVFLLGKIREKIIKEVITKEEKKTILNNLVNMTYEQLNVYYKENYDDEEDI